MALTTWIRLAAIAAVAALAGCGDAEPPKQAPDDDLVIGIGGVGGDQRGTVGDILTFDELTGGGGGGSLAVNKYLWKASLDTLAFLPIVSTDPFSGVIATDWSTSSTAPTERFKVTAYVTDVLLEARSLKVAVFREVKQGEDWISAPVDPATPRKIEDSILTRARMLKIEDLEEGESG